MTGKAKTAQGTGSNNKAVLTRHVCPDCGRRIPQNEITMERRIVLGVNGRTVSDRMEMRHASTPCGKAQQEARVAAEQLAQAA